MKIQMFIVGIIRKYLKKPELVNVVNTDLSKEFEYTTEDVVSGATFTTKSAMRAMIEVQRALGL